MKRFVALAFCVVLAVLPACRAATSGLVVGTGTILASQAECSSWFLKADSGQLYELRALPTEFQRSDLRVRFTLKKRSDLASVCMRGDIAEVISVREL